ncbi:MULTISPECIES: hypothetical protein [unclassified Granulicatella]|uniref:hypothetical protein n=1 Tax=unclassified Granulicatella TaxID=2630493 RepID=UPI001073FBBA|nr:MULTISPECIES: hypothetical protein [unclassified Granulicatella]MBF0780538.1 hypothetical protein [Granulicatella sp. 19428wC4_WM01]TFU94943.1 hypothetical protein E4T68_05460 [Granulicatella sp. WM01]
MIKIINIEWIDKDNEEAEVTLSDGEHQLVCFAHPFNLKEGESIKNSIFILGYEEIFKSYENKYQIKYLGNLKQYINGKVIDRKRGLVQVGEFMLGGVYVIPGDLVDGDYIEFLVYRCDI